MEIAYISQSNELTKEGVYIGAGELLDINLIWFGYSTRLSLGGGGGYFTRSNYFYLPLL
jgi:hypothetical protein